MIRSRTFTSGVLVCVLLGLLDIVGLGGLKADNGPPAAVALSGGLLGLTTLAGAALAWRGRPGGIATVIISRVLSALLGAGVFFADSAPNWARVVVGIAIAVTVVGVGLLLVARRKPQLATPRPAAADR